MLSLEQLAEETEELFEDKLRLISVWFREGVDENSALSTAIRLRLRVVGNGYMENSPHNGIIIWTDKNHDFIAYLLSRNPEVTEVYSHFTERRARDPSLSYAEFCKRYSIGAENYGTI